MRKAFLGCRFYSAQSQKRFGENWNCSIEPVCSLMGNHFYLDNGLHNWSNITAIQVVRTTSATEQDFQKRHLTTSNCQCRFLSTEKRLSVARFAGGFSQLANRVFAVSPLATGRDVGKSFGGVRAARARRSQKNEFPSLLIGDSMCAKNTDTPLTDMVKFK